MLKTLYIHFCQFDHVGTTRHVSGHRAVRRYFLCGPTFVLWLFLQVLKTSQCRGGAVEISNFYRWHQMMGLQHTTGPRQLSRLLGVGCSGCHLARGRDLAFNSCLIVRWGCHRRLGGCRGHSSRRRGDRGPSHRMISSRMSEFVDLATFICI
jgi:hypothetical protein